MSSETESILFKETSIASHSVDYSSVNNENSCYLSVYVIAARYHARKK